MNRVLKEALDPLDWDSKVSLMAALLERLKPHLPAELQHEPPERFAHDYETIVQIYVHSLDRVKERLKML